MSKASKYYRSFLRLAAESPMSIGRQKAHEMLRAVEKGAEEKCSAQTLQRLMRLVTLNGKSPMSERMKAALNCCPELVGELLCEIWNPKSAPPVESVYERIKDAQFRIDQFIYRRKNEIENL
jgi:hypothetical protein|tara:strand:+ start:2216 stop:2581 length:366 start_codon:yes stop_codon:yes gene_type:complete